MTEVLAAADAEIPETVRDAVLARAARLDDSARALLDAVAIAPLRAELSLLSALTDGDLDGHARDLVAEAHRVALGTQHPAGQAVVEGVQVAAGQRG
ncbi:MAG: hypothetical protein ACXVFM_07255, partial [Solirubrobacteraceae bacterium]